MRLTDWITEPLESLLDVGCNVGVWLEDCSRRWPSARLAGVEISRPALERARVNVPTAEFHQAGAESLPFPDGAFQHVTCIEVLEHLPASLRPAAFREMRRVLRPGGRLMLTVPHSGWFGWIDSNNVRLRLPRIYRWVLGTGNRDISYAAAGRSVEWHQHFTASDLMQLAGEGWEVFAVRRGGLLLFPLVDWLRWPFYRLGVSSNNPIHRVLERVAAWDNGIDYGRASYDILIVLTRVDSDSSLRGGEADFHSPFSE